MQNGDSLFSNASHFSQLKCTQIPAQGGAAKRTAAPLLTGSTKSRGSWWKIAARSTDLVTQQHQLRGVSSVIGDIRDPTIMLLFGRPQRGMYLIFYHSSIKLIMYDVRLPDSFVV